MAKTAFNHWICAVEVPDEIPYFIASEFEFSPGHMLNVKTVRDRLLQAPLQPFAMHLTDGRKILVEHPDFVAVGGSVVVVTDMDDNIQRIDSLHIVSLDDTPQKKRNGKHSR